MFLKTVLIHTLLLACLAGAHANDDEAPTGAYLNGEQVFAVNNRGVVGPTLAPPTDDEHQRARDALYAPPDLNTEITGLVNTAGKPIPDGHGKTVGDALKEFSVVAIEANPFTGDIMSETASGKICQSSRETLGKLLMCMDRLARKLTAEMPKVRAYAQSAKTPKQRKIVQDFLTLYIPVIQAHRTLLKKNGLADAKGNSRLDFQAPRAGPGRELGLDGWELDPDKLPSSVSPLHGKNAKENSQASDSLYGCVWGFYSDAKNREYLDIICPGLGDTDLSHFLPELRQLALHPTIDACFDLVRMLGLTRFMDAHRALRGEDIDELPPSCAPLAEGIANYKNKPKPKQRLIDSPAYRTELKAAARKMQAMMGNLQTLHDFSKLPGCGDAKRDQCIGQITINDTPKIRGCHAMHSAPRTSEKLDDYLALVKSEVKTFEALPGADYGARYLAAKREEKGCRRVSELHGGYKLKAGLEKDLTTLSIKYPLLGVGHDPKSTYQDSPPAHLKAIAGAKSEGEFNQQIDGAARAIGANIKSSLGKFCDFESGKDWENLIPFQDLQQESVKQGKQCGPVFECARNSKIKKDSGYNALKTTLTMAGCLVGSIGPQALVFAPACAAFFMGDAYVEYTKAGAGLDWTYACTGANSGVAKDQTSVCSEGQFNEAAQSYHDAVVDLYLNTAFAALEGAKFLKEALPYLKPSELKKYAGAIRTALKRGEKGGIEAIAVEVEALTSTRNGSVFTKAKSRLEALGRDELSRTLEGIEETLTAQKRAAIEEAHLIGEGKTGIFTPDELKKKVRALKKAGFSEKEREALIRGGVCGDEKRIPDLGKFASLNEGLEVTRDKIGELKHKLSGLNRKDIEAGGKAAQDFETLKTQLRHVQEEHAALLNAKAERTGAYKVVPMKENYVGEEVFNGKFSDGRLIDRPHYFNDTERGLYKLHMKDGKVYTSSGALYDTRGDVGIFVMDREGNFYSVRENDYKKIFGDKVNHSSFLAGNPVSSAGELVVEDGVLKSVNRSSGHYTPGSDMLDQAAKGLEEHGLAGFEQETSGRF